MIRVPYPEFGVHTSPIEVSNDGRLRIDRSTEEGNLGYCVVDTTQRLIAEGVIAGYDYREWLNRGEVK